MQVIARILDRSLPKPPADLVLGPALQAIWARCRPDGLKGVEALFYCRGRLFVAVAGSASAARLRQEAPDLLVRLRAEPGLADIRELVGRRPERDEERTPGQAARPLRSLAGSRCFGSLAQTVDDLPLKASLARLAAALATGGTDDTSRA